jgi:imidazolonepropionase-like amidohydrolase
MVPEPNPLNQAKALQVAAGTENAYKLAKKHNVKVAWGTDTLFDPDLATRQGEQLAKMVRWYTPAEVLTMATATNAQLLELSGLRNPYPQAPLGVVEEGAFADLLLIDGNPVEDITLIAKAETSMVVIMKNGTIHKNILGS